MTTAKTVDVTKMAQQLAHTMGEHIAQARKALGEMQGERSKRAALLGERDARLYELRASVVSTEEERQRLVDGIAILDDAISVLTSHFGSMQIGTPEAQLTATAAKMLVTKSVKGAETTKAPNAVRERVIAAPGTMREKVLLAVRAAGRAVGIGTTELRQRMRIDADDNSVRPAILALVKAKLLVRTGSSGKYLYALPSESTASAVVNVLPAPMTARDAILAACGDVPMNMGAVRARVGAAATESTVNAAVSELVRTGRLVRTGARYQYLYTLPKASAKPVKAKAAAVAARAQLDRAIESEASREGVSLKSGTKKAKKIAPPGSRVGAVLDACRSPMKMGALIAKLSHIDQDVVMQTVYNLVKAGKLTRTGERGTYVYETV
jgi:hypothetical protein